MRKKMGGPASQRSHPKPSPTQQIYEDWRVTPIVPILQYSESNAAVISASGWDITSEREAGRTPSLMQSSLRLSCDRGLFTRCQALGVGLCDKAESSFP
jgi:hypothetical protein